MKMMPVYCEVPVPVPVPYPVPYDAIPEDSAVPYCSDAYTTQCVFTCHVCQLAMNTQEDYDVHMEMHSITCLRCGEVSAPQGSKYYCGTCLGGTDSDACSSSPSMVSTEVDDDSSAVTHETPDLTYSCSACAETFKNLRQLREHQDRQHVKEFYHHYDVPKSPAATVATESTRLSRDSLFSAGLLTSKLSNLTLSSNDDNEMSEHSFSEISETASLYG